MGHDDGPTSWWYGYRCYEYVDHPVEQVDGNCRKHERLFMYNMATGSFVTLYGLFVLESWRGCRTRHGVGNRYDVHQSNYRTMNAWLVQRGMRLWGTLDHGRVYGHHYFCFGRSSVNESYPARLYRNEHGNEFVVCRACCQCSTMQPFLQLYLSTELPVQHVYISQSGSGSSLFPLHVHHFSLA